MGKPEDNQVAPKKSKDKGHAQKEGRTIEKLYQECSRRGQGKEKEGEVPAKGPEENNVRM